MSDVSDALDRVHPDFLDLLIRQELLPPDEAFSEPYLARLISIALDLAEDDEQAFLVSRIITDEELAFERLRGPEVRNTNHRIVLDRTERRIAFREAAMDPVPEQGNGEMCVACMDDAHMRAPCGRHNYCYPCYRELIRLGLVSQEGFPPRCCEPINEEGVALARAPALVHLFRQHSFRLTATGTVYCAIRTHVVTAVSEAIQASLVEREPLRKTSGPPWTRTGPLTAPGAAG
ncbi:uncharacterized protein LW94_11208 [Fusarium fujikuroi]|nr:uncharacterized protein LW94_11208 [Fusarium fujikuroi]